MSRDKTFSLAALAGLGALLLAVPAFAQSFTLDLGSTDATGPNSTTG